MTYFLTLKLRKLISVNLIGKTMSAPPMKEKLKMISELAKVFVQS
jgi:hypothetical protein